MKIHELPFPVIWENGVQTGYGGDQDWFTQLFQQRAGCASVTGANLAAYYAANIPGCAALYAGKTGRFSKEEYLAGMQTMYRYLTPGPMGYPFAQRFTQSFLRFAAERGVRFQAQTLFHGSSEQVRMTFLKEAIAAGDPVALLVLKHRAPEMQENNWHWVTVTGWAQSADGEIVILSNCGVREEYPAAVLLENHCGNVLRMARFLLVNPVDFKTKQENHSKPNG